MQLEFYLFEFDELENVNGFYTRLNILTCIWCFLCSNQQRYRGAKTLKARKYTESRIHFEGVLITMGINGVKEIVARV